MTAESAEQIGPKPLDLESASTEGLKGDVPRSIHREQIALDPADTAAFFERMKMRSRFQKTMQSAEVNRLHQQNDMRPRFFRLAAWLAWVVVLGNFAVVGSYAWHARENIEPSVLMFWISSTVVEVLGIVYIIAQYLFPKVVRVPVIVDPDEKTGS